VEQKKSKKPAIGTAATASGGGADVKQKPAAAAGSVGPVAAKPKAVKKPSPKVSIGGDSSAAGAASVGAANGSPPPRSPAARVHARSTSLSSPTGSQQWSTAPGGPGFYDIEAALQKKYSAPAFSIPKAVPKPVKRDVIPPPGAYDIPSTIGEGPKIAITGKIEGIAPSYLSTPGVGLYSPDESKTARLETAAAFTMGAPRAPIKPPVSPGPAAFDWVSHDPNRIGGSSTARFSLSARTTIPEVKSIAPGMYAFHSFPALVACGYAFCLSCSLHGLVIDFRSRRVRF
jgi:hypothetical protein